MTSATLKDRDDVDQLVACIEVVPYAVFELVDQLLGLDLLVLLLVAVLEEEDEVTQLFERIFVLNHLAREGIQLEEHNPFFDIRVVAGLFDQQRFDFTGVLFDLDFEFFAELFQIGWIDVFENQPEVQLRIGRRTQLFRMYLIQGVDDSVVEAEHQ